MGFNSLISRADTENGPIKGTLYIAGDAPNSRIAKDNLRRLCEQVQQHTVEVEVIDVLQTPEIALKNGIFVTPALQITEPAPGVLLFGNLNDSEVLQNLFG